MSRLEDAAAIIRGTRDPAAVAIWTGYRLGVLDAQGGQELFAGLLDDSAGGMVRGARGGYVAGRAGLGVRDVLDQLDRERHEAVARMTGMVGRPEEKGGHRK